MNYSPFYLRMSKTKKYHQYYYDLMKSWINSVTTILTPYQNDYNYSEETINELIELCNRFNVKTRFKQDNIEFYVELYDEDPQFLIKLVDGLGAEYRISFSSWFTCRYNKTPFYKELLESYNPSHYLYDTQPTIHSKISVNMKSKIIVRGKYDNLKTKQDMIDAIQVELSMCHNNNKYKISEGLAKINNKQIVELEQYLEEVKDRTDYWFHDRNSKTHPHTCKFNILYYIDCHNEYKYLYTSTLYKLLEKYNMLDSEFTCDNDSVLKLIIQDIIKKATSLNKGSLDYINYKWKNKEDVEPQDKIVALMYYKPFDWVIGVGVNQTEYLKTSFIIKDGFVDLYVYLGISLTLIIIIFYFVSSYLSN